MRIPELFYNVGGVAYEGVSVGSPGMKIKLVAGSRLMKLACLTCHLGNVYLLIWLELMKLVR